MGIIIKLFLLCFGANCYSFAYDCSPEHQPAFRIEIDESTLDSLTKDLEWFPNFLTKELKLIPSENRSLYSLTVQYAALFADERYSYKSNLIAGSLPYPLLENDKKSKFASLQADTLVTILEDQITLNGEGMSTETDATYVMSPEGQLCLWLPEKHGHKYEYVYHSYFFKKNGIGLPVACAGHLKLLDGKIIEINPRSGHYQPTFLQLAYTVSYLNNLGVISSNILIQDYTCKQTFSLSMALKLVEIFSAQPVKGDD